jgi:hypothetical protein
MLARWDQNLSTGLQISEIEQREGSKRRNRIKRSENLKKTEENGVLKRTPNHGRREGTVKRNRNGLNKAAFKWNEIEYED